VPEYTTEAGRRAALGAGAKIVGTYSYELTSSEIKDLEETEPDIILLAGGTDGGNKKVITHNAEMLLKARRGVSNIIVAGNKSAYDAIRDIFVGSGKNVVYTKNVMPEIDKLDVEPTNRKIREMFMNRITEAKGIARAKAIISDVIMPTPSAVLEAAKLIADGLPDSPGLGELMLVDVGGATTDVYSIAKGTPTNSDVSLVGLPEPYAKRTVEGDLGLVHNLETLKEIASKGDLPTNFYEAIEAFKQMRGVPEGDEQVRSHLLLSRLAVKTAVDRHVGRIKTIFSSNGEVQVQKGKDLTWVRVIVGSGGPVSYSRNPRWVLEGALFQEGFPMLLKPREPEIMLDKNYILYAVGLLAQSEPKKALGIIKKNLLRL
jgi:uncharacterized protein (TIGR01319 family)